MSLEWNIQRVPATDSRTFKDLIYFKKASKH